MENGISTRRSDLSAEKQALLERRLRGTLNSGGRSFSIPRRPQAGSAPLSFAQQRLWFLDQLEPNSPLYNLPTAIRLRGRLNREALERSLAAIVERHEALRTRFVAEDGSPVQVIAPPSPVKLSVIDLSRWPEARREAELQQWLRHEARRPFDLSRDLLMRPTLVHLADTEHVLMVNMHHIVSDAWSLDVFFRELALLYDAFCKGRPPSLPPLPIQYTDYAVWQREWMQGETMEGELAYWKRQLDGAPYLLELPADRPRPAVQTFEGGRATRLLPKPLAETLKRLSQDEGATLFMTLLAAFKSLLHRYTGQLNLVVGSPIAGRNQLESEALIGFFVNTLTLHTNLSGNPTFREVISRVRHVTLEAYAHQDLPFERLVEELQPVRSSGFTPLVQVLFLLQNEPVQDLKLPGLDITHLAADTGTSKFDLTLALEERADGLLAIVEYSADLFTDATIGRMLGHFQTLLEGIATNPAQRISDLPLLTAKERYQLLTEWKDTRTEYPREKSITQLFEEQVEKSPDAVALVFNEQQLTYRELNVRANQLAHHLRKLGVGPDRLVGVCMERSLEMIVALLGVLKAGGAYVSLDPTYPKERLAFMLEDAQAPVLLTQEKLRSLLPVAGKAAQSDAKPCVPPPAPLSTHVVCLDTDWAAIAQESLTNPLSGATAENLAYVSFTSGSTGRPKGVCVPQRGVVRLLRNTNYARFTPADVFLQLAPIAFDASTLEIWGALLNGARLVVFPPGTPTLAELGEFIQRHRVTTLWLTAGLFHQMVEEQLDSLRNVRQLLAGGDVLSVPHVKQALAKLNGCQLINGYGPTENTTFTCCHRVTAPLAEGRSIPIGRPVSNTQVYVLDEHLQPAPIGVPGELYIGGDGLARGYLNRTELTTEKFVRDPFSNEPGARLYKTGDLARWLPDGAVEFLGRIDLQVKIRGFRVELGEIEAVFSQHPAVRECVVSARPDTTGGKQLVAYCVPQAPASLNADELRQYLRQKLPDYMVPAAFVQLESLPLTPNGKVDRKALPAPDRQPCGSEKKFIAPRNEVEKKLAKIWESVLSIQPIGAEDHFFDLGGHSLLAVRLIAQIEKVFKKRIPVAAVFQSPTIAQLAKAILEGSEAKTCSSIVEIQSKGSKPPLFFVHGVGGGMFWGYTNLSRYLGLDQPVYAFRSRSMDGLEEFDSIEEMAAQYVADLRAFQPQGPYHLGGYCFGGNVAYEMARQLHAQSETVALLALMNCAPTNSSYTRVVPTPAWFVRFLRNFCYLIGCFVSWSPKQQREFIRWKARVVKNKFRRLFRSAPAVARETSAEEVVDLSSYSSAQRRLWDVHIRALMRHQTQTYPGRVTLFRSRGYQLFCSFDPDYGWGELATGGVTVQIVPGAHESILEEPHVQALAEVLKSCLREPKESEVKGL